MNENLWKGIGEIGDDLIDDAEAEKVKKHFAKKKRTKHLIRFGSLAACICIFISMSTLIFSVDTGEYFGISITEPGFASPEKPTTPYDQSISYRLQTEKKVYSRKETPVIKLDYTMKKNMPLDGRVMLVIDTGHFSTTTEKEFLLTEFPITDSPSGKLNIPLTTSSDACFGIIKIDFLFYPDDPENKMFDTYPLYEGAWRLESVSLSYAVNEEEIALSSGHTGAYDLYEIRLGKLYDRKKIPGKEFADRYFALCCGEQVNTGIFLSAQDGSFQFFYYSKNIRYESPFITDPEMYAADQAADDARYDPPSYGKEERKSFALLALSYMKEQGVITEKEYQDELLHLENATNVGSSSLGFDNHMSKYSRVLNENMLTHE